MCGLVGVASMVAISDRAWLHIARDTLKHRGPDDSGEWWSKDQHVGLAHRRLSIFDLTPSGHQPMHLQERGLTIVFNGEIYNFIELRKQLQSLGYIFYSQSDTEVLLVAYAEWGYDCLKYLNGMFAFVIYDSKRKKIFIARDRVGEKPLFYHLNNGTLFFASELKALLSNSSLPRNIDPESLDCYLSMGFIPGERCILSGYKKLAPAHAMSFDIQSGTTKVWKYWQLPEFDEIEGDINEASLVNELDSLLETAVGKQLVADVPVGILLSGGLDSSLITAMAARNSNNVKTFSIGFPGQGKTDETQHARLIASHFGTKHTELMTNSNTAADLLPKLIKQFDEPMVDSSMIPTFLVTNLVSKSCKVALGGEGGDELFGGYHHYLRFMWMHQHLDFIPYFMRQSISKTVKKILPINFKGINYLQNIDVDLKYDLPFNISHFDLATRRKLMGKYEKHPFIAESIYKSRISKQKDLLQRATRMDFENYLVEDCLVKVDRASMMNSLEIRSPMLDYRIIEFAFGKVPSHLKANSQDKKILLKLLASQVLPRNFDKKRKQGFSIPFNEWLKRGLLRDLFWDTLTSKDCIFDLKTVNNLFKLQDGRGFNGERLFSLVQFELWRKTYHATL
jgi:asparagine synthase (glutamine-hydrolysing)